jgi:hypothetical protein
VRITTPGHLAGAGAPRRGHDDARKSDHDEPDQTFGRGAQNDPQHARDQREREVVRRELFLR